MASIDSTANRVLLAALMMGFMIIAAHQALAGERIQGAFSGKDGAVAAADLGSHPMSTETYAESWGFVCPLDDGGFLMINMMLSNVGFGDNNPGLGLVYIDAGGRATDIPVFELAKSDAARNALSIDFGDARISGRHPMYTIKVDRPELSLDATVTAISPPRTVGDGIVRLGGGHFWRWVVLVPRGRIEGTLTVQGQARRIAGWVYADHTWTDVPLFNFSRNWLSARIHTDDLSIDLFRFACAEGATMISPVIISGSGFDLATKEVSWRDIEKRTDQDMGFVIPIRTVATADIDGHSVTVELTIGKELQNFDGLKRLPAVQRALAGAMLDHIGTYRFKTKYSVRIQGPQLNRDFQGECLVEMLYFRN